jgi:hypothetical protein
MIAIALLTLALGASVACGSKKAEEAPKAAATAAGSTAASATAAPKAAATAAASTQGIPGGAPAITSATFAKAICNDYKGLASGVPGAAGPPTSPSAANLDATATQTVFKQMVEAAPPELKPDFTVMAKYFGDYSAAMSRAGGDMMKLAQDAQFMAAMQNGTADIEKATKNIEAWQAKNCR